MGKSVDWVQEDSKTGRLIFRRRYPDEVRPFLAKPGQRELKVPLGAKFRMTADAFRAYEQAKRRFDKEVADARAARQRNDKSREGLRDALSSERIAYLADLYRHQWHSSRMVTKASIA